MMKAGLSVLFLSLATVTPAFAVEPPVRLKCYAPQDYRAEQAIRYHTQLMVAGMLCQDRLGPQSYSQYQGFTTRNQGVITKAENRLIGYFRDRKEPAPEKALHTLRTNLANDLSMRAMQQALPVFCANAGPRLQQAALMQPRQFESYLMRLDLRQASTAPLCSQAPTVVPVQAMVKPVARAVPAPSAGNAAKQSASDKVSQPVPVKTDEKSVKTTVVKATTTVKTVVKPTVTPIKADVVKKEEAAGVPVPSQAQQ